MSRRRIASALLLAGAAGTAVVGKRNLDRRVASWDTNLDSCDGDPTRLPDGDDVEVVADDGSRLRGLDAGSGPTILVVHCWTGTNRFWAPVACRLVDSGFRVVAVDQRGHGRSERGTAAYRPETLAGDIRSWIEQLDIRDAVLAGHSMGGLASMAFAIEHPGLTAERLRGLVLVATLAAPPRDPRLPDLGLDTSRLLPVADLAMRPHSYGLLALLGVFGTRPARSQLDATRDGFRTTDRAVRHEAAVMMNDFDLRPGLGAISVPTRVVAGTHDQLTFLPTNEEIAELIPGASIEVLPGLGHMLPWEAPDQVTDVIVQTAKPA